MDLSLRRVKPDLHGDNDSVVSRATAQFGDNDKSHNGNHLTALTNPARATIQYGHSIDGVTVAEQGTAHFGDSYVVHQHHYDAAPKSSDNYETLVASLSFQGMDARAQNVAAALPTTCEWLLHHRHFVAWADDEQLHVHSGFLWIKGKPGSGKSTIMKETLDWAERNQAEQVVLSYFFNARSPHLLEKSSLGLYRSLVQQLLRNLPRSRNMFTTRFSRKINRNKVEEWTEIELQNFLIQLVKMLEIPPTMIFIDALDEGAEEDMRQMVQFLERFIKYAMMATRVVRICLSSRHYPHISIKKGLSLVVEDQAEHAQDIELYLKTELVEGGSEQMEELRRKIRDRAAGVFLWVVLVVPILNQTYDQGNGTTVLLQKVEELPPALHDVFNQILLKSRDDLDECIVLLQWVMFAMRPLTPIELYLAVHYTYFPSSFEETSEISFDEATRYLHNCSRGLVELTKYEDRERGEPSERNPTVQFIHESIRDYLLNSTIARRIEFEVPSSGRAEQIFVPEVCHTRLAETSINYLLKSSIQNAITSDGHGYRHYAARYWWVHMKLAEELGDPKVTELAFKLLTDKTKLLFWLQIYDVEDETTNDDLVVNDLAPPLYYAAHVGEVTLISAILALGVDVNAQGGRYGSALCAAVAQGHVKVTNILLDAGACIHPEDSMDALHLASSTGYWWTVELLLDHGADVNRRGRYNRTALLEASIAGLEKAVRILLDAGADVNGSKEDETTALYEASSLGHENIVRSLIEAGAEVNRQVYRSTALLEASIMGHEKVVRMLLDTGAIISRDTVQEMRALLLAIEQRREKILQLLLDAGANPNLVGFDGKPLLHIATRFNNEHLIPMLLKAGAKVTQGDPIISAALRRALREDREDVVQFLLDAGADVNARGFTQRTALELAKKYSNKETIKLLSDSCQPSRVRGTRLGVNDARFLRVGKSPKAKSTQHVDIDAVSTPEPTPTSVPAKPSGSFIQDLLRKRIA